MGWENPKDSFIAPIHRLPAELLRSIILLSYEAYNSSRWKLGWIDSRTRSIVLSTPFLWTTVQVSYRQHSRREFNSLIEELRVQLRRCGPVLPLDISWVTATTEHHITRLLWLFIEENAPFSRWRTLLVHSKGVFPSEMLGQEALGEFTMLQKLYISGSNLHFFFHHLEKTRDLSNLEMLHSTFSSGSYEELSEALPRVLSSVKLLITQPRSTFSSGLPQNIVALECAKLRYPCRFPHLKQLTVGSCSIRPNPSDIPLVTNLKIYFRHIPTDALVLEFPALISLALECALKDLRPLTWLSAPNLTSIKLEGGPKWKYSPLHHDAPHVSQLNLLNYSCATDVEINIPLAFEELSVLLPRFPAVRRMIIRLDVTPTLEGVGSTLFALLHNHDAPEKEGRGEIRYKDLETVCILPASKEIDTGGWDATAEALMKRFPNGKLRCVRIERLICNSM